MKSLLLMVSLNCLYRLIMKMGRFALTHPINKNNDFGQDVLIKDDVSRLLS
jgi:hypothetical protein